MNKEQENFDLRYLIKSLINNWLVGLVIFLLSIVFYYFIVSNQKVNFTLIANIDGLSFYQKVVFREVNSKINELQKFDRETYLTKQISSFSNLNLEEKESIIGFILQSQDADPRLMNEDENNILSFNDKYIYVELINLLNSKKFFSKVIDKYKKLNPEKLDLINKISKPQATLVIRENWVSGLEDYVKGLLNIEVIYSHTVEHSILEEFNTFFFIGSK